MAGKLGIRKTDEVPPRYAVPDVIELVKGPGSLSRELSRLRAQYPEVFAKEVDRVRGRYGDRDPNLGDRDPKWISVRFRDSRGRVGANVTPVATLHGILDKARLRLLFGPARRLLPLYVIRKQGLSRGCAEGTG